MVSGKGWIILTIANIPLYILMGGAFFKDWHEFIACIEFWVTPDIVSGLQGEYWNDRWSTLKLGLWLAACIGSVVVEGALIKRYFG